MLFLMVRSWVMFSSFSLPPLVLIVSSTPAGMVTVILLSSIVNFVGSVPVFFTVIEPSTLYVICVGSIYPLLDEEILPSPVIVRVEPSSSTNTQPSPVISLIVTTLNP